MRLKVWVSEGFGGRNKMQVALPYGRSLLNEEIPDSAVTQIASPRRWSATPERDLVKTALMRPTGVPRLRELARHKHNAVIVTCDKTRGVPSRITLPFILDELRAAGMNEQRVTILVATGLHKGETILDVKERFGTKLIEKLDVTIHDSDDQHQLAFLGNLHSGTPLFLNKEVTKSDLIIVESTVEPHFFAGFTGGAKVILPGVAGTETILRNHCWQNIDDVRSRQGIIDNPIRADANEALSYLKTIFSLNLILDGRKRVVYATSGDIKASFNMAAEAMARHCIVQVRERPDVVITTNGGYPLDRNVYQCVKGIAVAEKIVHVGSRIVMVGECVDGVSHEDFLSILARDPPDIILERIKKSDLASRDQWEVQILCRIMHRCPVWFVTRPELSSQIESMRMHYASTVEKALESLGLRKGERVLVLPEGPSTILGIGSAKRRSKRKDGQMHAFCTSNP
jgi:nickel-dependent lactate racemase